MNITRTGKRYCQLIVASRGLRGLITALRAILVHSVDRYRSVVTSQIVRLVVRGHTFELDLGRRELASVLEVLLENSYALDGRWLAAEGDTILDVGANIGVYSVLQAARTPGCRVYAFEPSPNTFGRLVRNIHLNNLPNVDARCQALGAASGTAHFLEKTVSLNSCVITPSGSETTVQVPVESLDDFVAATGVPRIDLLKIDTEGHELPILRGGRTALRITRRVVLETHGKRDEVPIQEFLERSGFRFLTRRHDLWFFERAP